MEPNNLHLVGVQPRHQVIDERPRFLSTHILLHRLCCKESKKVHKPIRSTCKELRFPTSERYGSYGPPKCGSTHAISLPGCREQRTRVSSSSSDIISHGLGRYL